MLQRLERAGLVERRPCPNDARVSRVHLTLTGQALEPAVRDVWRRLEERMLAGLSDAEQIVLRRLLKQIQENLDEGA
jgi:DNA-binding MarR family transcriptional regulator